MKIKKIAFKHTSRRRSLLFLTSHLQIMSTRNTLRSVIACLILGSSQMAASSTLSVQNPFYLGLAGGYGSSTWGWLVPNEKEQSPALALSMPIKVTEGGGTWGLFAGYEFTQNFAVELTYLHYPDAQVSFHPQQSLFSFNHKKVTGFITHTETVSLMGKFMLPISHTKIKPYSSFGVAEIHREDIINIDWRVSPTFGLGFTYNITPHLMGDLGANYTAGYAEAQLEPTNAFYPFLYSVVLRLSYRL